MLAAVDVMLDIAGGNLLAVSSDKPPIKLRFLTETVAGIHTYAIAIVPHGMESTIAPLVGSFALGDTLLLLLERMEQRDAFRLSGPHFFVVREGGSLQYFQGK